MLPASPGSDSVGIGQMETALMKVNQRLFATFVVDV
jgi:hypothetical protein